MHSKNHIESWNILFLLVPKKRIMESIPFFPALTPTFLLILECPVLSLHLQIHILFRAVWQSTFAFKLNWGNGLCRWQIPESWFFQNRIFEGFRFFKKLLNLVMLLEKYFCFQISVQCKQKGSGLAALHEQELSIITVFDSNSNSCCWGSWATLERSRSLLVVLIFHSTWKHRTCVLVVGRLIVQTVICNTLVNILTLRSGLISDEKTEISMFGYDSVVITAKETLIPHLAHVSLFLQDLRDTSVFLKPLVLGAKLKTTTICLFIFWEGMFEGPDGKNSWAASNDSQNKV